MGTSKLSGKPDEMLGGGGGVSCNGLASHPGGVAILLVASCYRDRDKLQQLNLFFIRKPQVISGGRGAHPLHPPPRSAPEPG